MIKENIGSRSNFIGNIEGGYVWHGKTDQKINMREKVKIELLLFLIFFFFLFYSQETFTSSFYTQTYLLCSFFNCYVLCIFLLRSILRLAIYYGIYY